MKITVLGTATSIGVPVIGCRCGVCLSDDPRDKRLRASVLVETEGRNIVIDCGPDFRQQILRAGSPNIDAVLLTHCHTDHVGGIDDLRPYTHRRPNFPLYCRSDVEDDLRRRLPYCFADKPYPGAPTFNVVNVAEDAESVDVEGVAVTPLPVMHGRLPILGWRIGPFAYITDASYIPETTFNRLHGVDTLIINGLRAEPHPAHFSIPESLKAIERIAPRQAYLTHLAMEAGRHADLAATLPEGVAPAWDGLVIDLPGIA